MANFNIDVNAYSDWEFSSLSVFPTSLSVGRGDTITIRYSLEGTNTARAEVSGLTADRFSPSGVFRVNGNTNGVISVLAGAVLGDWSISVGVPGLGWRNVVVTVVSGVDTTPDDFSFVNITAEPSILSTSNTIRILGINTPVTASALGGEFNVNGSGSFVTSATINNGDRISLRQTAPASYNMAKSMSLTVGSLTRSWVVSTLGDPSSGQLIPFPVQSGTAISLSQVINFFGGPSGRGFADSPKNLASYVRGGSLVPNILRNAGISTSSAGLRLSQFIGSASSLYFVARPGYKSSFVNTLSNGTHTLVVSWNFRSTGESEPRLGFGSIGLSCEYRYRVVKLGGPLNITATVPAIGGITLGQWSSWTLQADSIHISANVPAWSESQANGTVEFEIRNPAHPSIILYASTNFDLYAFGP